MEALFRLMWDAFIRLYTSHAGDGEERLVDEDALIGKAEECRHAITRKADVQSSVKILEPSPELSQRCLLSGKSMGKW